MSVPTEFGHLSLNIHKYISRDTVSFQRKKTHILLFMSELKIYLTSLIMIVKDLSFDVLTWHSYLVSLQFCFCTHITEHFWKECKPKRLEVRCTITAKKKRFIFHGTYIFGT